MKYIITENKIQKFLSNILDSINIRVVTDGKEMVFPSGKYILQQPPRMWNEYIKQFGPIYVMKYNGVYYVVQYQTDRWMISDESGYIISENDFIESLGIRKFGINLEILIELKTKNELDYQNIRETKNSDIDVSILKEENDISNKLMKIVYKKGVLDATMLVGDYQRLLNMISPNEIPIEMKADAIKDYLERNSDGYGLGTHEIGLDPILWKETYDEIHQIEYLGNSGVIVQVWGGHNYSTDIGEYGISYEALPHEILNEILFMITS
jgi:hypothetical protein